jgi:two-component system, chemotaxis family, protein-glutamate methylesterase/glutaminase
MNMDVSLRVLVVDDAVVYRKIVGDLLAQIPGVEVVGTAANGRIALQKIEALRPDLITLDLAMPEMDGLAVLLALQQKASDVGVIMLSALTDEDAQDTVTALKLGAFDFVLKPNGHDLEANARWLKDKLAGKIDAFVQKRTIHKILHSQGAPAEAGRLRPAEAKPSLPNYSLPRAKSIPRRIRAVALGISTGGPNALTRMLPQLPADLAAPVLIVQHMPPLFTRSLAEDLNQRCRLRVAEAEDHQLVQPGEILIAPGGRQMKVVWEQDQVRVRLTDDPHENSCRPSVDYLFRSVAEVYGGETLAVIMTGMGNDGARGCRLLKQKGAAVIAQDAATCVVYGMPREPIEQGIADVVAPLDEIASTIVQYAGKGAILCK